MLIILGITPLSWNLAVTSKRTRDQNLARTKVCHRNFNSISAHNYIKISLLRAYISTHKFDVTYISKTYLDSDDDNNLKTAVHNLVRADHPTRWCLYLFQLLLFLRLLNIHYFFNSSLPLPPASQTLRR